MTHALAVVLLLLAIASPASAEGTGAAKSYWLSGWLSLSSEGRVTAFEHDESTHLPDALRQPSESVLQTTVFEPARSQGQARESRSWLHALIVLEPRGEQYAVTLTSIHLGPRPHSPFSPPFGRQPTHPVRLLVDYVVDEEGKTRDVRIQTLDGRLPAGMARRMQDYVRGLRFDPVQVAGLPVATRIQQPMAFRKPSMPPAPFELTPPARDPTQPGALGQTAYSPELIFTATHESFGTIRQ